jgi:3-phosphoshikimate 1-carboxyvinyltransferase
MHGPMNLPTAPAKKSRTDSRSLQRHATAESGRVRPRPPTASRPAAFLMRFVIPVGRGYQSPGQILVEGDASSATYFLAAGALGGGPLRVGADIRMGENWMEVRGLGITGGKLAPLEMDCNLIPDAAMTLAVVALFATGPTTLCNIASWRAKETDRLAAMSIELRKVGATAEEGSDYIVVTPPEKLTSGVAIDTPAL